MSGSLEEGKRWASEGGKEVGTGRRERGGHREEGKRWAPGGEKRGGHREEGKRWAPGGGKEVHCKSEDLRKYFYQVYGTLQIALVHFFGNLNKKA